MYLVSHEMNDFNLLPHYGISWATIIHIKRYIAITGPLIMYT